MTAQRIEKGPRTTRAEGRQKKNGRQGSRSGESSQFSAPSISLHNGGGAVRGMGEKFAANPVTGAGSMTVPIAVSPGRSGTENLFTNANLELGDYRAPLSFESRSYELLKVHPSANVQGITNLFRFDEPNGYITSAGDQGATQPYQEWDADEEPLPGRCRLLIEHLRTLYRKNDLSSSLTLAALESLALPYETYDLVFTLELVMEVFQRETNGVEENLILDQTAVPGKKEDGGYVHREFEPPYNLFVLKKEGACKTDALGPSNG